MEMINFHSKQVPPIPFLEVIHKMEENNKVNCEVEDSLYFEKCKKLCYQDISLEQLDVPLHFCLPFTAAIIELANIDNCKCPEEKLNCLCATFDLIYAELKYFLIKIFCSNNDDSSDLETPIPIVENQEALLILLYVVIKSKPVHLLSNIFAIKNHLNSSTNIIADDDGQKNILNVYEEVVDKLSKISSSDLKSKEESVIKNLDHKQFIQAINENCLQANTKLKLSTPLEIYNSEAVNRILLSTNNNGLI